MKTTVVHCKKTKEFDVYIGRPSIWGNPFSHKSGTKARFQVKTRRESITRFKAWIKTQPDLMAQLKDLRGKVLGCWCKPQACHGDVLAELANALEEPMTDYSIPTLTFEGLSTWEEAQRKVQAILTSHRWECSDVITRDSILSLWGNGQTFGCRIQCDKDNNPKEVIEIPDLIVDLYQDETGMHVQFSLMDTWRADRGDQ